MISSAFLSERSATFSSIDTNRAIAFAGFSDATRGHFGSGTEQVFGEVGYNMTFGRVALISAGGEYGGIGGDFQIWTWRVRGSVAF